MDSLERFRRCLSPLVLYTISVQLPSFVWASNMAGPRLFLLSIQCLICISFSTQLCTRFRYPVFGDARQFHQSSEATQARRYIRSKRIYKIQYCMVSRSVSNNNEKKNKKNIVYALQVISPPTMAIAAPKAQPNSVPSICFPISTVRASSNS